MDFNFSTISNFDNHINSSICGYDILHALIINISTFFIQENDPRPVVDLGCTSGKLLKDLGNIVKTVKRIGYDITDHNFLDGEDLRKADITSKDFIIPDSQLIYSIFTLQFIAFPSRLEILTKIQKSLSKTGAFIFCEKEYTTNARIQEVFTFSNYDYKRRNFSDEEILKKERDIRKIMTPTTSKTNLMLLEKAGFINTEVFF